MNEKVLVKLDKDWADEFTVQALWLTTKPEFENFIDKISKKDIHEDIEIYFGTNEYFNFDSSDDLLDSLSVIEVTDDFYYEFINITGTCFGMVDIESLLDCYDDLEDEGESKV